MNVSGRNFKKKSVWNINILKDSEINDREKIQTAMGDFFLLYGQRGEEIVQCRQVKIEHTATLITLLADREVQLRPWEGNYSHNVWKADMRDGEGENEWGREKGGGVRGCTNWKKDVQVIAHRGEKTGQWHSDIDNGSFRRTEGQGSR